LKNVAQMHLHRVHGDLQVVGDLLVAPAGRDVFEDLAFAGGELVETRAGGARRGAGPGELFQQAGGERRRNRGTAVGEHPDRVVQRVQLRILEQVAAGTGAHGGEQVFVLLRDGEDADRRLRRLFEDGAG